MSEATWAQIISGLFGLASMALGVYLPHLLRREKSREEVPDRQRQQQPERDSGTQKGATG